MNESASGRSRGWTRWTAVAILLICLLVLYPASLGVTTWAVNSTALFDDMPEWMQYIVFGIYIPIGMAPQPMQNAIDAVYVEPIANTLDRIFD